MPEKPGKPFRDRSQRWDGYLCWNAAVAEVVYPVNSEMTPSYMDLEADTLQKVAAVARYEGSDPQLQLAEAVRSVTVSKDHVFSLHGLVEETSNWSRDSVDPPPCLAFLALSVVAAEDMGKAGEGVAANAYYARLARLLSLPDGDAALRRQYRMHAEFLWSCVNVWLENLDGERGLPTAYALSHRHVGLPMSQALVRKGDRQKFPAMFAQYGLSPGMRLAPDDLVPYLDAWVASESSTASLRRLWQRPGSHDRIASIAAVELANWDGLPQDSVSAAVARALVVATLRTGFLGSSLELFLGLRPQGNAMDGRMEVLGANGEWLPLGFDPGIAGIWRTAYTNTIDFDSALNGLVRIRHLGQSDGLEYKRLPKAVVPLVYDELQSAYVQSERLELGADAIVLARTDAGRVSNSAASEVERVLDECARPGFSRHTAFPGLPRGWTLFTDVQLFGTPTSGTRFDELVPLARNQLTIAGGLRIPSRVRKWSTLKPPEIRAIVQSETKLRVTLSETLYDRRVHEWNSDTGTLAADLADLALTDGDYELALFTGSKKTPNQQVSLSLRSSKAADPVSTSAPRLMYSLIQPLGTLSASVDAAEYAFVDGLVAEGESGITATVPATAEIFWSDPPRVAQQGTVRIGTPDPTSCVNTGAHFIQLPPSLGGKRIPKIIEGVCTSCGLVKRYPGWLPRWRSPKQSDLGAAVSTHLTVSDLPPVTGEPASWDAARDALTHMHGGPFSSLESVATQIEGSALFVRDFTRSLEALGHIAIERDEQCRPRRWQMSPPCIARTAGGNYRLAGSWPSDTRESLVRSCSADRIATVHGGHGPTETFLTGIDEATAELVAHDNGAHVAHDPGGSILATLPRISVVSESLARSSMPGFDTAERFELSSASWTPTGDPSRSGAYRLRRGFETLYLYRSENDVDTGCAAITSANVAKHLAANEIGWAFMFYHEASQSLLSPLGCELPGLYERAAVALSGRLPETKQMTIRNRKRKCLTYTSIDRHCADLLVTLLTT